MITVLGSINMDLVANVSRLPAPGETVTGTRFMTHPGGKGANQALAARRAGAKVALAGAVGEDQFAVPALVYLRQDGVNLDRVRSILAATGVALIFVADDGENVIAIVGGANQMVTPEDARATVGAMKRGDVLVMQLELPADTTEAALVAAREIGVTTIINIAPVTPETQKLAALADIVIANETEFELYAGKADLSDEQRIEEMRAIGAKNGQTQIVTLGADGVVAVRGGKVYQAQGLKIEPVDTVGAGDTFCGYFAAALDMGLDLQSALNRAAVAGSLACLKAGAQPSIPFDGDVVRRMKAGA